jgi:hypothetical protein
MIFTVLGDAFGEGYRDFHGVARGMTTMSACEFVASTAQTARARCVLFNVKVAALGHDPFGRVGSAHPFMLIGMAAR